MRLLPFIALPMLATLVMGCRPRRPEAPSWVLATPGRCEVAVSGQASWLLEQPQFQSLLAKYPLAEQSLDLFLKKAHISPHGETGRITLFVLDPILDLAARKDSVKSDSFLLQFQGFRDPKNLQIAVAESFPAEGSLVIHGNDLPLHVVLDINQVHIRILTDLEGNIWLGELTALTSLGSTGTLPRKHPVVAATAWIDSSAPLQGFLRPDSMLKDFSRHVPDDISRELPKGIDCLAWSVNPGSGEAPLYAVSISITGSPEGILQATPWLQRIVALTTSIQPGSAPPPELLQEQRRAVLRCRLTWEQLSQVLSKINQPNLVPNPGKKAPRP